MFKQTKTRVMLVNVMVYALILYWRCRTLAMVCLASVPMKQLMNNLMALEKLSFLGILDRTV